MFLILIFFYFIAVGFVSFIFLAGFLIFLPGKNLLSGDFILKLILINSTVSLVIAFFHFYDARKFGAKFIRKRLKAQSPDLSDRYHKQFTNIVEEIRIASGLPQVIPYIIPDFAINSMALIEADNTPSVVVTEGLLAEYTRDELQAVASHEMAHVIRGDAFYITLVCSLANFFERIRQALEPENYSHSHSSQVKIGRAHV